jgi:hypothetical protein
MTTISTREYFAQISDEIPEEILKILKKREYENPTTLSKADIGDFEEIFDEIYENLEFSEEFNTVIELVLARAEREHELLSALNIYGMALDKNFMGQYSDMTNAGTAAMESGIELVWLRLRDADNLDIRQKQEIFSSITSDEDTWDFPVLGLLMSLAWNLTPTDMDRCIVTYSKARSEDISADAPWSKNCQRNYMQWMHLLAVAALNSSGSQEITKIIEKTSRSSSVGEFWLIICCLARYTVDPEAEMFNIFPDNNTIQNWDWGTLLFDSHYQWIKGNAEAVDSLIDLYQKNSEKWPWDFDFYDNYYQKTDIDQFIQLWKEKIDWIRNQKNYN